MRLTNEQAAEVFQAGHDAGDVYGYGYWARIVAYKPHTPKNERGEYETVFEAALRKGGTVSLIEDCGEGDTPKPHTLTIAKMKKGIRAAAEHAGLSLTAFVENCDGAASDNALQFALLNELRYG